jgi:hypothetical protein
MEAPKQTSHSDVHPRQFPHLSGPTYLLPQLDICLVPLAVSYFFAAGLTLVHLDWLVVVHDLPSTEISSFRVALAKSGARIYVALIGYCFPADKTFPVNVKVLPLRLTLPDHVLPSSWKPLLKMFLFTGSYPTTSRLRISPKAPCSFHRAWRKNPPRIIWR